MRILEKAVIVTEIYLKVFSFKHTKKLNVMANYQIKTVMLTYNF